MKILVVEDEAPVAKMLMLLLTRAGCAVQTTCNAEKAVKLVEGGVFDLITLDVDMPGTNGFTLCERLKQIPHSKDTPVIFVSGRASPEDRERAFELAQWILFKSRLPRRIFFRASLKISREPPRNETTDSHHLSVQVGRIASFGIKFSK